MAATTRLVASFAGIVAVGGFYAHHRFKHDSRASFVGKIEKRVKDAFAIDHQLLKKQIPQKVKVEVAKQLKKEEMERKKMGTLEQECRRSEVWCYRRGWRGRDDGGNK